MRLQARESPFSLTLQIVIGYHFLTPMETPPEKSHPTTSSTTHQWFYGWVIVALCTAVMFVVTGTKGSFGALFKAIQFDLGWDRGTTAGISTVSTAVWALSLPLVGRMVDRHGAKLVMVASIVAMVLSVIPMYWVQSIWAIYLFYGVLPGMASSGASTIPAAHLIGRWFYRHAGIASGIFSSALPLGTAVFAPLAAVLVPIMGWRLAYIVLSASLLLILPFTWFFLRDHPRDGEVPETERPPTAPSPSLRSESTSPMASTMTLRDALRTPLFRLLLLSQISCGLLDLIVGVHFIPFVSDHGLTEVFGAVLLGASNLIAVAGTLFGGWLCDHVNRKSALCVMHGLRAIGFPLLILFGLTGNVVWLYIFTAMYGATVMMGFPPTSLLIVRMYGHRSVGTLYGSLQVMHHLGMGAGAYFAGVVFDQVGSYYPVFAAATVIATIATIGMFRIDERRRPYFENQGP